MPFQLYLAATVANLTLVASKAGLPEDTGGASKVGSAFRTGTIHSTVDFIPARLCQIWALALLASASLPNFISPNRAFPARFLGQHEILVRRHCTFVSNPVRFSVGDALIESVDDPEPRSRDAHQLI